MEKNWSSDENKNRKKLKPWHGAVLFGIVMLSFYTIIAWAQMKWGMYGLALTELYLLFLSIFAVKLLKIPLKEIFPLKRPKWKKTLGVLLMWVSSYALMIPVTMFMAYFFPKQMFAVSEGLNEVIYSVPLILSVFISSVMPAVCEEALHRGFILKSFQSKWKNKWFLSVLMGIIFGLFHGSIWRFLPTAILGGILTYIMLETENMFYPALFHFTNNFLPSFLLSLSGNSLQTKAASELLVQQGIPVAFFRNLSGNGMGGTFWLLHGRLFASKRRTGKETAVYKIQWCVNQSCCVDCAAYYSGYDDFSVRIVF